MLLERFGLWEVRHERVSAYSRGMTQRLALCRVLLHDPSFQRVESAYRGLKLLLDAAAGAVEVEVLSTTRKELVDLDEPYSALDEAGGELLDGQLADLRGARSFLLATHEPARVEGLASGRLMLAA